MLALDERQASVLSGDNASTYSLHNPNRQDSFKSLSAYTSPLDEFPNYLNLPLPPPLQVLDQYVTWHSQQALERDANVHHRTFMIAQYQCPVSAGNWMHYFTSAFLWGILTNRTILWKYVTNDACRDIRRRWLYPFHPQRCNVSNSMQECHEILERAPWIPSYDEWSEKLNLTEDDVFMLPLEHSSKQWNVKHAVVRPVDVSYRHYPVLDIHPWSFLRLDHLIYDEDLRQKQLATPYGRATLKELARWGPSFLFGLSWRHSFDYSPRIRERVKQHAAVAKTIVTQNGTNVTRRSPHVLTIGIHSRHTRSDDDGCNVRLEQDCMRQLLNEYRAQTNAPNGTKVPCQVTLASDRTCTIDKMSNWLSSETLGCAVVVTERSKNTPDSSMHAVFNEHGPFSGSGFFQDMLLAGMTVRDAMIGSLEPTDGHRWRSSSELMEEAITYQRDMAYWQAGMNPERMPELVECTLKRGINVKRLAKQKG
ncbi:hypothetical protein MPSEU_000759700 [Mayamaea pseudoterrestris]|nr:hypothetical protein MPSEU_000759700 [Mayamaea pseudoterrestris]